MDFGGVFDNPVTKQRPVLHQSKHMVVPPDRYPLAPDLPGYERSDEKLLPVLYFGARSDAKPDAALADRFRNGHEL
jgi:hypothetical protein